MIKVTNNINNTNSNVQVGGTCPHGLPKAACPICSGFSCASSGSKRASNPSEMTWDQCAAIGAILRHQKAMKVRHLQDIETNRLNILQTQKQISSLLQKFNQIMQFLNSNIPRNLANFLNNIKQDIVKPTILLIQKVFTSTKNFLQTFINNTKEIFKGALEKFVAILGDVKNFWNRKLSESFKNLPKKIVTIFEAVFKAHNQSQFEDELLEKIKRLIESTKVKYSFFDIFSKKRMKDKK